LFQILQNENLKSNFWHYHPEIELVFVGGGSGKDKLGAPFLILLKEIWF
jgi:hypothetical protein